MRSREMSKWMGMFAFGLMVVGAAATGVSAMGITFNEDAGTGDAPIGAQEDNGEAGFFGAWDFNGRTVALAEDTTGVAPVGKGQSLIEMIQPSLWTNDGDLWKVNVANTSKFSASSGGGHLLALFDSTGAGLAAVIDGTIDNSFLTGTGIYYIGLGADGSNARNAAGQNIFNAQVGVASGPVAGDTVLAADPFVAWELNNAPNLIGPGNFTRPSSKINLPEPASLTLLGLGGLMMLRRRSA